MFVCLGTYTRPIAESDTELVQRHGRFLDEHYRSGILVCSGPREPRTGGLIIVRGTDRPAAEALIDADPFVLDGLASYEIVQFLACKAAYAELLEENA